MPIRARPPGQGAAAAPWSPLLPDIILPYIILPDIVLPDIIHLDIIHPDIIHLFGLADSGLQIVAVVGAVASASTGWPVGATRRELSLAARTSQHWSAWRCGVHSYLLISLSKCSSGGGGGYSL